MKVSTDSLKLRIPFDQVTVLEPGLEGKKVLVNTATGDIEKEFKQQSFKVENDGISTYYGIEKQMTADQVTKKFAVILFNSKLLKDKYLNGITSQNIKNVYESIIRHKVISLSFDDFMNGECVDVDFKRDLHNDNFDGLVRIMVGHAKPHKHRNKGYNVFNTAFNKGIEFGKRETATPGYPFLKVYHKGLELEFGSKDFFRRYLKGVEGIENLIRVETTIKNKKHFRKHGINSTTLESILSIDQDKLSEVFENCINLHLDKRMKIKRTDQDDLKPYEQTLLNSISMGMEFGLAYDVIKHNLTGSIIVDKSRKRTADKLDSLYFDYIKGSDIDTINEQQESFLSKMGWKA